MNRFWDRLSDGWMDRQTDEGVFEHRQRHQKPIVLFSCAGFFFLSVMHSMMCYIACHCASRCSVVSDRRWCHCGSRAKGKEREREIGGSDRCWLASVWCSISTSVLRAAEKRIWKMKNILLPVSLACSVSITVATVSRLVAVFDPPLAHR